MIVYKCSSSHQRFICECEPQSNVFKSELCLGSFLLGAVGLLKLTWTTHNCSEVTIILSCCAGIMQVQMPVENPQHHDHVQALEQAMASISQGDLDKTSLMEIEDETHPLAPIHLAAPHDLEEEVSRKEPAARDSVSMSSSSVFQGQNFTHMYAQPVVIDVQDEEEEGKGIEVSKEGGG